jgi:hypothetical protein
MATVRFKVRVRFRVGVTFLFLQPGGSIILVSMSSRLSLCECSLSMDTGDNDRKKLRIALCI